MKLLEWDSVNPDYYNVKLYLVLIYMFFTGMVILAFLYTRCTLLHELVEFVHTIEYHTESFNLCPYLLICNFLYITLY